MKESFFEQVPHTADLKIRVYGNTLEELFVNALKAMFLVIEPSFKESAPVIKHSLDIQAYDQESLLVSFLSQALYFSDVYQEAYTDAHIELLTTTAVKATIIGKTIKRFEVVEIKAVTYHELSIEKYGDSFVATIVFDI